MRLYLEKTAISHTPYTNCPEQHPLRLLCCAECGMQSDGASQVGNRIPVVPRRNPHPWPAEYRLILQKRLVKRLCFQNSTASMSVERAYVRLVFANSREPVV